MVKLLAIVLLGAAAVAQAEDVVTLVPASSLPSAQPISFIKGGKWEEQGYVRVRALLDNPDEETCISPTTSVGGDNIFFEKKQDVVVTARVAGFANVDSSQEVPIAVYSWQGAKYCRSAFREPVILVPYTPLRRVDDPRSLMKQEPSIVLYVKSSSEAKERITAYAQAALAISSEFATGGAATTVAALTSHLSGQTVKTLVDFLNSKSTTDQTVPLRLTWKQLTDGLPYIQAQIKRTSRTWRGYAGYETVKDAVDRLKLDTEGKPVLTIRLVFDVRRSILTNTLDAQTALPSLSTPETEVDNVLNFPRLKPSDATPGLSVSQLVNDASPTSVAQTAAEPTRASGCARLRNDLRDAFAYDVDAPVIFDATMKSIDRDWNLKQSFYALCLTDALKANIEAYRKDPGYFAGIGAVPEPELASGLGGEWKPGYTQFLQQFRAALFSVGELRALKLKALIPEAVAISEWPQTLASSTPNPTSVADYFKDVPQSVRVGCMHGFKSEAGRLTLGLVVVAKGTDNGSHPYLLMVTIGSTGGAPPLGAGIEWFGMIDLEDPAFPQYAPELHRKSFGTASICGKRGATPGDLLKTLTSTGSS